MKEIPNFKVEVIFGDQSKSCSGSGICQVMPVGLRSTGDSRCKSAIADLYYKINKSFEFVFFEEGMCSCLLDNFNNNPNLVLDNDCSLPKFILDALGLPPAFLIKNAYPIVRRGAGFNVLVKFDFYPISPKRLTNNFKNQFQNLPLFEAFK